MVYLLTSFTKLNSLKYCALQDIGEEFVEFLEKELNISDADSEENKYGNPKKGNASATYETKETGKGSIEDNLDDIEAALTQLKKELGL